MLNKKLDAMKALMDKGMNPQAAASAVKDIATEPGWFSFNMSTLAPVLVLGLAAFWFLGRGKS
jgi:hypothetical protein